MRFRQAVKIYKRWFEDRKQYRKTTLAKARLIAHRWTKKVIKRNEVAKTTIL